MSDPEQLAMWNGPSGRAWVDAQSLLDGMFRPFENLLADAVQPGDRVLDVGCGTGATTLAACRRAGTTCTGIDISEPMLAVARERAAREGLPAAFVCADAQAHALTPATFDLVISRFGVMFFEDPVRAFANLRTAVRPGGGLRMVAWRGPDENPFMTAAERAAGPLVPNLPTRKPGAPGQFGLADPQRVRRILEEGGWSGIAIQPLDVTCSFPASELDGYVMRLGPLGRALEGLDEPTRSRAIAAARAAFEPYVHGSEVRYVAACWLIAARP